MILQNDPVLIPSSLRRQRDPALFVIKRGSTSQGVKCP